MNRFERRDPLFTKEELNKIDSAKVALFGLGGVGGYVLEMLVRSGIKDFILVDGDTFSESNLNRQLLSLENNLGSKKVDEAKKRVLSINSESTIKTYPLFINENTINDIDLTGYYIVDCIDDIKAKVLLAKLAKTSNLKIISAMGAGNRIDAEYIVSDIYKTEYDPLAKKMRAELKKESIDSLKVVYTKSLPLKTQSNQISSFAPVVAKEGIKIAYEVIKDIIK